MFNDDAFCLNGEVLNLSNKALNLNDDAFCLNAEVLMFNDGAFCLNDEALNLNLLKLHITYVTVIGDAMALYV
ncbi:MAG: hypothetical protein KME10_14385 [Plectolyngbya sp. WJT66-NPBG17]|jgi:hypothetical protein|nr:hypothetical protein [Plectolyngbya sp. WJT66-NPBG17]